MAEETFPVIQNKLNCSICLDLLNDPVTIPCGHSYCMNCITNYWNQEDQKRNYSCPQCRQTFTTRPDLGKNTMVAEVVEMLEKTKLQADEPSTSQAESGDVECDVCTEKKHKAVKSCLVCQKSYCQNHLQQHEELNFEMRHKVTEATGRLQQMICTQHKKPLEIYCQTDQLLLCNQCMVDEHNDHKTVSTEEERNEKQDKLLRRRRRNKRIIKNKQKNIQELRDAVKNHESSVQTLVDDTDRIFTELIQSIERRRCEMIKLIRDQEKTAVSESEGVLKKLEQEIDDLRRRDTELEQLLHTDDHIHFLQSFPSLSVPPESSDSFNITLSSLLSNDDVDKSVSHLREIMEDFCKKTEKILYKVTPEPETREQFLKYYQRFTADPNTAHKRLCLSDGNRKITKTDTIQSYPDHPDRFDQYVQVLCRESVNERCYWEIEWNGDVHVSVSYKNISRKGWDNESGFGYNDQSWLFSCSDFKYLFLHNNKNARFPAGSGSSRIGVYVNHSAGILSFYSISDTMNLIHRVQTTFTKPLYPGFYIMGSVKL